MLEQMIERIEKEIENLKKSYEVTKEYDVCGNARIQGMIEMLQIVTGKQYYYNESGLHERV